MAMNTKQHIPAILPYSERSSESWRNPEIDRHLCVDLARISGYPSMLGLVVASQHTARERSYE
jgi:hypothetical protein